MKRENEHSTIGIILCRKSREAIVEITLPKGHNIHAKEYRLYLPSKEELKRKLLDWTKDQDVSWFLNKKKNMLKESETIEFKKSTAEVSAKGGSLPVRQAGASGGKAGVVSIAAMLNKYSRVVEAGRLEFKEGKNRKI